MIAASCNGDDAGPTPAPTPSADTLRLGYPSEPPTLDPLGVGGSSAATRDILRPVLPALFRLNDRLRPEPELAAAWPAEADVRLDPFTVTVRLREANWSDGRPITAEDVRFSWERLKGGPTGYRYRFLRDVVVVDQRTFKLHFDRRVRRWWSLFSLDDMVLPAHAYSDEWAERPTVSGGPYSVREWTEGLKVSLVRNESYWGQKAVLAGIDVLFVPSDETRFQLMDRGELDAFVSDADINIGRRARARGYVPTDGALDGKKAATGAWGPSWWELDLRTDVGTGVKSGIVEAVDPALIAEILEDTGAPMDGIPARFPVPAGPIAGTWSGRGSVDEARQRVATGGDKDFSLAFPRSGAASTLANYMHFRLRELGITVELLGLDSDAFERTLDDGSYAAALVRLRRGADAPDTGSYTSDSREPGSADVAEQVEGAETGGGPPNAARRVGVDGTAWSEVQDALEQQASATPLARVRTWIIGRGGLAGPRATGASPGPLWNAATWRFL